MSSPSRVTELIDTRFPAASISSGIRSIHALVASTAGASTKSDRSISPDDGALNGPIVRAPASSVHVQPVRLISGSFVGGTTRGISAPDGSALHSTPRSLKATSTHFRWKMGRSMSGPTGRSYTIGPEMDGFSVPFTPARGATSGLLSSSPARSAPTSTQSARTVQPGRSGRISSGHATTTAPRCDRGAAASAHPQIHPAVPDPAQPW